MKVHLCPAGHVASLYDNGPGVTEGPYCLCCGAGFLNTIRVVPASPEHVDRMVAAGVDAVQEEFDERGLGEADLIVRVVVEAAVASASTATRGDQDA